MTETTPRPTPLVQRHKDANGRFAQERMTYDREFIESRVEPIPMTGCWIWMRAVNSRGYGALVLPGKKAMTAHRLSYTIYKGPVPEGLHVLHRCDVRCCVNPDHLWPGTDHDNQLDSHRKGRRLHVRYNPISKLTSEQVLIVKESLARGIKGRVLAASFGVSEQCISDIKVGRKWTSVSL